MKTLLNRSLPRWKTMPRSEKSPKFSETNGKSIMPRIDLKRFLGFLGLMFFLAFWGCGTKSEKDGVGAGDTSATAAQSEDDKLEAIINEAMGRLRYKDKT